MIGVNLDMDSRTLSLLSRIYQRDSACILQYQQFMDIVKYHWYIMDGLLLDKELLVCVALSLFITIGLYDILMIPELHDCVQ